MATGKSDDEKTIEQQRGASAALERSAPSQILTPEELERIGRQEHQLTFLCSDCEETARREGEAAVAKAKEDPLFQTYDDVHLKLKKDLKKQED